MNSQIDIYASPFSEDTKKIRRNLLVASCVCIFIGLSEQLPTSFALWGAKFDANQQPIIGWFIFSITFYLFLHFLSTSGVEIAKWIQPFYEGVQEKKKLLKHPAFDETDWMEFLEPDDPHNIEHVQKMAKEGWKQTPVTYVPGVYVSTPDGSINFLANSVIVNFEKGQYVKSISPSEYRFLIE